MPGRKTVKKPRGHTYKIHDNGSKPFIVHVAGKKVSVMQNMDKEEKVGDRWVPVPAVPKPLMNFTASEVFTGKMSPTGDYFEPGNSILLKVGSKYVYIGNEIYEFTPMPGDTIVQYYSDIGNSDVPYPYAVGKTHIYIMLDKVAVELSFFDMKEDIYRQYYDAESMFEWRKRVGQYRGKKEEWAQAQVRIAELKTKMHKLKSKQLQKRLI